MTPSQKLALLIVERLVREQLLTAEDGEKLLRGALADGSMRAEDWRLSIEVATEKGKEA